MTRYRREQILIDYVRMSELTVEKEIYEASDDDAMIKEVRPPFYPVFEQTESIRAQVFQRFSLQEWALALFNSPREMRSPIREVMNDKQWFSLIELLKQFDKSKPDAHKVGLARERIGIALREVLQQEGENKVKPSEQSTDEDQEEKAA